MFNGGTYNADLFNGSGYGIADALTYSPDQPYILQVRNSSGTMLAKVEDFIDGSWKSSVNSTGAINLTFPLDSDIVQSGNLAYPNRIWLYDSTLEPLQQFIIVSVEYDHTDGTCDIEGATLLYLLDQEYRNLDVAINVTTVRDCIESLLASQVNANPIPIGFIHPTIATQPATFSVEADMSILTALQNLRKSIGGIISIDSYGRLKWDWEATYPPIYGMTLYDDIETYKETINTDTVINRIYAEGKIYEASATSHYRPAPSGGYVEDTASQAIYGIRPMRMTFNTSTPSELDLRAGAVLQYLKDPQVKRDISAIDLARVQLDPDSPTTPHPEYIYAGARIKITPPSNIPNASAFNSIILSVDRSLTDFLGVTITVGDIDPRRTASGSGSSSEFFDELADIFEESFEWDETFNQQDADIWAALDTLQGDFNTLEEPETDVNEIQPVGAANALGANTKFAPSDHEHEGIIKIYNASYDQVSDLPTPSGMAIAYISDDAQGEAGWYKFPEDGSTNADWEPLVSYA